MPESPMYLRYPIEALARRRFTKRQLEFGERARRALGESDEVRFECSEQGPHIHAADELSLGAASEALRSLYGDFVEVLGPTVRIIPGDPARHPVMKVHVGVRSPFVPAVREELFSCGASILDQACLSDLVFMHAEAPLANLLGLSARLAALTGETATLSFRLDRYDPVTDGPPGFAA
jgi:hypothetical protein